MKKLKDFWEENKAKILIVGGGGSSDYHCCATASEGRSQNS